jgi:hypothetical protein
MFVRIRLAATAEVYGGIASQPEIARIELGMLAGEHERRSDPTRGKRMGDLVPMTSLTSTERSTPPNSAGAFCLRYGAIASGRSAD